MNLLLEDFWFDFTKIDNRGRSIELRDPSVDNGNLENWYLTPKETFPSSLSNFII